MGSEMCIRDSENGVQQMPLTASSELELGDLLGTFPCPLLRAPITSFSYDDGSASSSTPGIPDERHMFVPGPVTLNTAGFSPTPACANPPWAGLELLSLHRMTSSHLRFCLIA